MGVKIFSTASASTEAILFYAGSVPLPKQIARFLSTITMPSSGKGTPATRAIMMCDLSVRMTSLRGGVLQWLIF